VKEDDSPMKLKETKEVQIIEIVISKDSLAEDSLGYIHLDSDALQKLKRSGT
jgi:hypothetical protein